VAAAVEGRRNEFRSGRIAAREALARLGCEPAAIPAHAERDPVWPAGFIGSIAHAGGIALALVARAGPHQAVGIDIEEASPLEPHLIARICRADERADQRAGAALPGSPEIDYAKLCFVAKEAVLKALLPRRRAALRFDQLRVQFDARQNRFDAWLHERADDGLASTIAGVGRFYRYGNLLAAAFVISESTGP
jgi:4'-phosphopantetheinyl transferase EntD